MENGRSTFVTAVAWTFIVLAGLATLVALLQARFIMAIFVPNDFAPDHPWRGDAGIARGAIWAYAVFSLVSLTAFVSAIGLLLRKNWARIALIVVLGLGVLWNVFVIAAPFVLRSLVPDAPHGPGMGTYPFMLRGMQVFVSIIAAGFAALFAWLIANLISPEVRAEFDGQATRSDGSRSD